MEATNLKTTSLFTFSGSNEIIDIWGEEIVKCLDTVVVVPYFKEKNQILVQYKSIPSFQLSNPGIDRWIVLGTSELKGSECLRSDVETCLKDQFGMTIEPEVEVEILAPIFIDEMMTKKLYICILPLMQHQFELEAVSDDSARPIALNCSELPNYIIYDIQTRYCIDLFKKEYSLF